ncbi:MAG: hypothetical protein HC876_17170 [Chloroflexaceae bacterium]|nr:hypothetical protein [Chloroflexaceae bacterium]
MLDLLFFRRRPRNRFSPLLLIVGVLGLLMACILIGLGVPASFARSQDVRNLPRVEASALVSQPPGTRLLTTVQLPATAEVTEQGLVLFYIEERQAGGTPEGAVGNNNTSQGWQRVQAPPSPYRFVLPNGETVQAQFTPSVMFFNAQTLEPDAGAPPGERRIVGYLPQQALTLEATWEGNNLLTVRAAFAGAPDAYTRFMDNQPGGVFLMGIFCGITALLLLGAGVFLWIAGR